MTAATLCRCGHGSAYHDAGWCRLCVAAGQNDAQHSITPAEAPVPAVDVVAHAVDLCVAGAPDADYRYGNGRIHIDTASLTYSDGGVDAHLSGRWVADDGELTDSPCDQSYEAPGGDTAGWPDWLAALARECATVPTSSALIHPDTSEDGLR